MNLTLLRPRITKMQAVWLFIISLLVVGAFALNAMPFLGWGTGPMHWVAWMVATKRMSKADAVGAILRELPGFISAWPVVQEAVGGFVSVAAVQGIASIPELVAGLVSTTGPAGLIVAILGSAFLA